MNSLNVKSNSKQEALEVVINELERNLETLQANYMQAVSNLNYLKECVGECVEKDDLTKLTRRGAFMSKFYNLLRDSKLDNREICVFMIDIDYFKKVNDTHGHQTGDIVLEQVARLVQKYLRPQDLAGRYGGEEIIVAVQAGVAQAYEIAERIRKAVEDHQMKSVDGSLFQVTLSMGIASSQDFEYEADVLIDRADKALYFAKHSGRNQIQSQAA